MTNDDLDEALALHSQQERDYVKGLFDEVMAAFPDGAENHRIYHAKLIKAAQAEEDFWRTAKQEIIKAGVVGMIRILWAVVILAAMGLSLKLTVPDVIARLLLK